MNLQPIEPKVDGQNIDIVNCWYTIQGEGPLAGTPAVFVRLAGCNLACDFCDTIYTTGREKYKPAAVVDKVEGLQKSGLVVITGGEPFRQNIGPFIGLLLSRGYRVQIETNGTIYREAVPYENITIVCSPKTPKIDPRLWPYIDALKYVLEAGKVADIDGLPVSSLGMPFPPARPDKDLFKGEVFVQPLDTGDAEANKEHTKAAVESCMKHGYRFCLQQHKLLGLE